MKSRFITILLLLIAMALFVKILMRPRTPDDNPLVISIHGKTIFSAMVSLSTTETNIIDLIESTKSFDTSSDYFKWVFSNTTPAFPIQYFSMPGFLSSICTNISELNEDNNMWCILEDKDNTLPETAPFLLSSNLQGTNISDVVGCLRNNLSFSHKPRRRYFTCVTRSGAAFAFLGDDLDLSFKEYFHITNDNYRILRP